MSNGYHHQVADENPIVAVYTTEQAAVDVVRNIIHNRIERFDDILHTKELAIDSEVLYRVGVFDSLGNCKVSYSVIKQGMML